jgi:Protein of unknown function (DUF4199)
MKSIVLKYGAAAGLVTIGGIAIPLTLSGDSTHGFGSETFGYSVMALGFSLVFFGIKKYRDQELGGVIKFGTALAVGLGITLTASLIYVVVWELYLSLTDYAFMDAYTSSAIAGLKAQGLTGDELAAGIAGYEQMKESYGNPLFRLPMTFLEIFPMGLVISLISAGVLKNSKVLAAEESGGEA